jgi:hypothetical protein
MISFLELILSFCVYSSRIKNTTLLTIFPSVNSDGAALASSLPTAFQQMIIYTLQALVRKNKKSVTSSCLNKILLVSDRWMFFTLTAIII